jgi:hypothetical protein
LQRRIQRTVYWSTPAENFRTAILLQNLVIKDLVNPLKPKPVQIIFKDLIRTSKKTLHFTITKINWLMLFKEIIAVYTENHKSASDIEVGKSYKTHEYKIHSFWLTTERLLHGVS